MAAKPVLTNSCNFVYTRNVLPEATDSTTKKIIKIAIIFLSLGTILVAAFILDLSQKVYTRLTKKHLNAGLSLPNLTGKEKIVKTANKFWSGFQEGAAQIKEGAKHLIHTISYNANRQSPYNKYATTAGYMTATTLIFYLAAGYRGAATAAILNLIGLSSIPYYHRQIQQNTKKS